MSGERGFCPEDAGIKVENRDFHAKTMGNSLFMGLKGESIRIKFGNGISVGNTFCNSVINLCVITGICSGV